MKLTKAKLRQIVKEELGTLREAQLEDGDPWGLRRIEQWLKTT